MTNGAIGRRREKCDHVLRAHRLPVLGSPPGEVWNADCSVGEKIIQRGCRDRGLDVVGLVGKRAKLRFHVHPHMLRHSTGYYLANRGYDTRLVQDYLGHKNIAH